MCSSLPQTLFMAAPCLLVFFYVQSEMSLLSSWTVANRCPANLLLTALLSTCVSRNTVLSLVYHFQLVNCYCDVCLFGDWLTRWLERNQLCTVKRTTDSLTACRMCFSHMGPCCSHLHGLFVQLFCLILTETRDVELCRQGLAVRIQFVNHVRVFVEMIEAAFSCVKMCKHSNDLTFQLKGSLPFRVWFAVHCNSCEKAYETSSRELRCCISCFSSYHETDGCGLRNMTLLIGGLYAY
jgi:hypothetical protein